MQDRRVQIEKLKAFIQRSPHPVICVGDFNDLPYSYAYQALKKDLHNTFEEAGSGFGFTRHGRHYRQNSSTSPCRVSSQPSTRTITLVSR